MRVMVFVKATDDSEKGFFPRRNILFAFDGAGFQGLTKARKCHRLDASVRIRFPEALH
jgi:hypothetical protein